MWLALAIWSVAALGVAISGVLFHLPPPVIPLVIWAPVIALVLVFRRSESMRAWLDRLDVRVLVGYHVIRIFFGASFLVFAARGQLPASFADMAGWGDVLVGTTAFGVLAYPQRRLILAWNVLGLLDILAVFVSAQRLIVFARDPLMLARFGEMPFSLLPVLVVPLVIATHLAIFLKVRTRSLPTP
jgi:hypothetical protein